MQLRSNMQVDLICKTFILKTDIPTSSIDASLYQQLHLIIHLFFFIQNITPVFISENIKRVSALWPGLRIHQLHPSQRCKAPPPTLRKKEMTLNYIL